MRRTKNFCRQRVVRLVTMKPHGQIYRRVVTFFWVAYWTLMKLNILTVFNKYFQADEILKGLSECLGSTDVSKVLSNEEMCPVCECSALNLTFRLELCGHLYCSECIQGLVDQAEFPLKCCADVSFY